MKEQSLENEGWSVVRDIITGAGVVRVVAAAAAAAAV